VGPKAGAAAGRPTPACLRFFLPALKKSVQRHQSEDRLAPSNQDEGRHVDWCLRWARLVDEAMPAVSFNCEESAVE
jgi:hypothetical protein